MADDLNAIVQRMIDAGESDENIGTVIQHFRQQQPPAAGSTGLTKVAGIEPEPTTLERIGNAIGPSIRGAGDVTGANWLLEHTGLVDKGRLSGPEQNARDAETRHATGVGGMAAGAMELGNGIYNSATNPEGVLNRLRVHPGAVLDLKVNQPLKTLKDVFEIAPKPSEVPFASTPGYPRLSAEPAPAVTPEVTAPTAAPVASETGGGFTAAERAQLAKQGYTPQIIAKIEGQLQPVASHPSGAAPNVAPARQMLSVEGPFAEPPTAQGPTAADREAAALTRINGNSQPAIPLPMQGARVGMGAEQVGRSAGMTPTEVRLQTGPILGEAPGEASHVFPQKPLERMIDRMKALPKEGTARVDYVQAAKDPKTMAQLENLRRTLAHLGLAGAGAVGSRQMLVNGLDTPQGTP